jgi:hypothetical protein
MPEDLAVLVQEAADADRRSKSDWIVLQLEAIFAKRMQRKGGEVERGESGAGGRARAPQSPASPDRRETARQARTATPARVQAGRRRARRGRAAAGPASAYLARRSGRAAGCALIARNSSASTLTRS